MNLSTMLQQRAAAGRPIRIGLIGAGKFGSMVLAQAQRISGFHVVGVADLDVGKARASLARVGWPAERYSATSLSDANVPWWWVTLVMSLNRTRFNHFEYITPSYVITTRRPNPTTRS